MHGAMRSRARAPTSRLLPPCPSRLREVDTPRSTFAPLALAWIAPCEIRVILFASKINHRLAPPAGDPTLKLEVRFCVQGVISPLAANIYLTEIDWMFDAIRRQTAHGPYEAVNYHRFADDLVITISGHRTKRGWAQHALQRLEEQLIPLGVTLNREKTKI